MKLNYPAEFHEVAGVYHPSNADALSTFDYSDGDAFESKISDIISTAVDKSLFSRELTDAIWDWRSSCHLSPGRSNLLRPLEPLLRGRVLELGAGCGPITRYLGELGADVVALEASPLRASVVRARTQDLPNVAVVCSRIENFGSEKKFDAVTMIGVLQYARMFGISSAFAEMDLLKTAAEHIKPGGVVILSIQNKLGLKYLGGFPEPNVGVPYFGIENNYDQDSVIRFGLDELKQRFSEVGLEHQAVLFPFPDYHMPVALLSPRAVAPNCPFNSSNLLAPAVGHDRVRPDWRRPNFSLERAWETIERNGMVAHLANAFLFVAGKSPEAIQTVSGKDLAWHYATVRHPGFATGTRFRQESSGKITVERVALTDSAVPDVPISQKVSREPYRNGRLWWLELVAVMNRPGWDVHAIARWATPWIDALLEKTGREALDPSSFAEEIDGSLFDATPTNLIGDGDGLLHFFDQEWTIKTPLTLGYLMFRGLFGSLSLLSSCSPPKAGTPLGICDLVAAVLKTKGVPISEQERDHFLVQEARIQRWVVAGRDVADEQSLTANLRHYRTVKLDPRPSFDLMQAEAIIANRDIQLAEHHSALAAANSQLDEARQTIAANEAQLVAFHTELVEAHKLAAGLNSSPAASALQSTEALIGTYRAALTERDAQLVDARRALARLQAQANVDQSMRRRRRWPQLFTARGLGRLRELLKRVLGKLASLIGATR